MGKFIKKLDRSIVDARIRLAELMSKEDGMETLETVIVVILAIVVAGAVITMIGKNQDEGILKLIYDKIKGLIENLGTTQ